MKSATFEIDRKMSGSSNALTDQAPQSQASGDNSNQSDTSERNHECNVHVRRYTVDSSFHSKEIKAYQNSAGDCQSVDSKVLAALKSTGISSADSKVLATLKSTGISFPTSNFNTTD